MKKLKSYQSRKTTSIKFVTTNDHLNGKKFDQKRGYRVITVIPNGINKVRNLKSSIHIIGNEGIPFNDE